MTPFLLTEWFIAGNLGFLAVDIYLAHASNAFARHVEWLPIVFSIVAPLALLPGLLRARWRWRPVGIVVGTTAIFVGLLGMIYHLESGFFAEQTLHELVYTAPFVAPLSYVGIGLLLLLDRMEGPESAAWPAWVVLLALGGFIGNLGLSLLDHAQNGFFSRLEWLPVGAAAFAVSFLATALARPEPRFLRVCLWLCGLEALVGIAGFALHVAADLRGPGDFIHGAPPFAPLLFTDLAALAALGLWAQLRAATGRSAAPSAPAPPGETAS